MKAQTMIKLKAFHALVMLDIKPTQKLNRNSIFQILLFLSNNVFVQIHCQKGLCLCLYSDCTNAGFFYCSIFRIAKQGRKKTSSVLNNRFF